MPDSLAAGHSVGASPIIFTVRAHGTMPNSLTTEASLKLGAIVIETFFKHYLERNSESSKATGSESSANTTLREQDLLWQESFEIIKVRARLFFNVTHTTPLQSFLNQATKYVKSTWLSGHGVSQLITHQTYCGRTAGIFKRADSRGPLDICETCLGPADHM